MGSEDIKIVRVNEGEFEKEMNCSVPVLADFGADWCGPCKTLWPKLEQKFNESQSFKLIAVNIDNNEQTAEKYEVEGLPTVMLFKDGKCVDKFVGMDLAGLDRLVALTK